MSDWFPDYGKQVPPDDVVRACFCMGPQNGEPLCRCRMRDVIVRDGRYVLPGRDVDLGPVRKP